MVLLSFDIEEFDMPFEYKGEISFEQQISISQKGVERILDILKKHDAKATFFSTVVFAENSKDLIRRLLNEGQNWLLTHGFIQILKKNTLKNPKKDSKNCFQHRLQDFECPE